MPGFHVQQCTDHLLNKSTVRPRTGHEDPQAEWWYSSTISALYGVGGQCHDQAALPPGERSGTHCIGSWVRPSAGLDGCGKSRPHRDFFLFCILLCSVLHPCLFLCPHCPAFCLLSLFTTHNTNTDALGGIRTRNTSTRSVADPLLRPFGFWDRRIRSPNRSAHNVSVYRLSYPGRHRHRKYDDIKMHLKKQDELCTGFIWLGIETRVVSTATNIEVGLRTEGKFVERRATISFSMPWCRGYAVVLLVEAVRYKPEGRGFDSVDSSGRAVQGVGLWPLACWDCEFESRRGHGCLCSVLYSKR